MKEISPDDIILSANVTFSFCHETSANKDNNNLSIHELFQNTAKKRKWSIINPGMILASAYSYFVFGQEKKFLTKYPERPPEFLSNFKVKHKNEDDDEKYQNKSDNKKCEYIKRRLRNSITHCKYSLFINTPDGKIKNDGDLLFIFKDDDGGKGQVEFEITLPAFGNIVENAGHFVYKHMKA